MRAISPPPHFGITYKNIDSISPGLRRRFETSLRLNTQPDRIEINFESSDLSKNKFNYEITNTIKRLRSVRALLNFAKNMSRMDENSNFTNLENKMLREISDIN